MKKQKEAVMEEVKRALPNFVPYKDMALIMLSKQQLELVKENIGQDIMSGKIEYSKPLNRYEVVTYARSMVMNHLKKAKELNGNQIYGQTPAMVQSREKEKKLSTVNIDILPEDLKAFVKILV
jgi:hypothetical protein